jgi:hypothetical protein
LFSFLTALLDLKRFWLTKPRVRFNGYSLSLLSANGFIPVMEMIAHNRVGGKG